MLIMVFSNEWSSGLDMAETGYIQDVKHRVSVTCYLDKILHFAPVIFKHGISTSHRFLRDVKVVQVSILTRKVC